jgi:hypothetical protein
VCTITNYLIGDVHLAALGIASPTCSAHSQRLVQGTGTNRTNHCSFSSRPWNTRRDPCPTTPSLPHRAH